MAAATSRTLVGHWLWPATRRCGLRQARPRAGETVLVEAAAGGVGTLLVQLARNADACVIGAAGGERKLKAARNLGAEVTVYYRADDWPHRVREAVGAVDVVFDCVGGGIGREEFGLLGPGGRFCPFDMASGSFADVDPEEAAARGVAIVGGGAPTPEQLLALTRAALGEAAAGRLRPLIGQKLPLEDAAAAHAAIESRATIGKTPLLVQHPLATGS